jgi:hypothetical protein
LTLISAHALLHQASRERDTAGRVVATLADYAAVRDLVMDLLTIAVQATVSTTVRETVLAVSALNGSSGGSTSLMMVARQLHLDKGTVSRRVKVAVADGYLRNLETRKNQPMQLVLGDPLPDELSLLPAPREPEHMLQCCSVADGANHPLPRGPARYGRCRWLCHLTT